MREELALPLPLLHAVFAEDSMSGSERFEDGFDGLDLADGHEGYAFRGAMDTRAGIGDLVV
jgi:hypothetical protein